MIRASKKWEKGILNLGKKVLKWESSILGISGKNDKNGKNGK